MLLFVKCVSDKYFGQPFAPITIPPGASFADMVALKGTKEIGDDINKKDPRTAGLARMNMILHDQATALIVQLRVPATEIKTAIFSHPEFTTFHESATKLLTKWNKANTPHLTVIDSACKPKALIEKISEALLATFEKAPLLDPYDSDQHFMDYWAETMQDGCYLIPGDGCVKAAQNDRDKLTKASVIARMRELRSEGSDQSSVGSVR